MPNVLSSAKTVWQVSPGIELAEGFKELLVTGLDEAFSRKANTPMQGEQFFKSLTDKKGYRKYQATAGTGLMKQAKDTEDAAQITQAMGFGYEYGTVTYKTANAIERELMERELYGQIGDQQRKLAEASHKSIELICADVFNRGHGGLAYSATQARGTGLSQFICEDGCYLIDSNRPNPIGTAGTWSNRLPDVAWTAGGNNDAVFANLIRDAKLKLKRYKNDSGDLSPMTLKRLIISPALEDMAMRVTDTKQVYSGDATVLANRFSDQSVNTIAGTKYTVYDWLSDGMIYFEANGENELELLWRVKPSTEIYTRGNPDVFWQRIRMAMGIGCPRPATWMGCVTTGTENL
jgi:hypothetical protein